MNDLNQLPAPPKGQTGVNPNQFAHLPPPPQGVQGIYPDQIKNLPPPPQKNDLLNNPITRGIQNIFPGQKVGQAIGTLGGLGLTAGKEALGLAPKGTTSQYDTSAPSPLQVGGDIAQGALAVASPNIGTGGTVLGRIGANAALGAGLGATNSIAQGEGVGDTAKNTAIGGALGGGISAGGELASYLTENMPKWFTRLALPKLSSSKVNAAPEDVVDYALNNSKGATLKSMYINSNAARTSYEGQIQAALSHPQYQNEFGSKAVMGQVIDQFSNAQLTPDKVIAYAKNIAPTEKALVDKVANGTANLVEKNALRKALDLGTKARFTDTPKLSFAKQIGGALADALRKDVKTTAPETVPIFKEYSKELALNKALANALSRKRVAGPLVAGAGGFAAGGIKGAAEAVTVEEGLRSPTARLLAGKAIQGVGKVAMPAIKTAIQGGKAPLIKAATNRKESQ